jgi:hypothetical protein
MATRTHAIASLPQTPPLAQRFLSSKHLGRWVYTCLLMLLCYIPFVQAEQYVYDRVVRPERSRAVAPVFSKPDTFWPTDWWGRETGFERTWYDPALNEGLFNHKDMEEDPRDYWLPKHPEFDEVDLEAFNEQAFNNYTPYAVGMLPYHIKMGKRSLKPGVYQFKLGQWDDGSIEVNLRNEAYHLPDYTFLSNSPVRNEARILQQRDQLARRTYGQDGKPQAIGNPPNGLTLKEHEKLQRRQDVIIATQGGKVMGAFLVDEKVVYPEAPKTVWGLASRNARHEQWGAISPVETLKARVDESEGRPRTRFTLDAYTGKVRMEVCQKHVCYQTWVNAVDVHAYAPPVALQKHPHQSTEDVTHPQHSTQAPNNATPPPETSSHDEFPAMPKPVRTSPSTSSTQRSYFNWGN